MEKDSPLRRLDRAYLTPHRAGGIYASVQRVLAMLAEDYEAHLAGEPLKHAVTMEMLVCFPE